jgi:hypothetical protein
MNPEASETQEAPTAATVPDEALPQPAGTEHTEAEPKIADVSPSEVLPDSAQYYGNEELVAAMEKEKTK